MVGGSCQVIGEPAVHGEQRLESFGAPVGEGRIRDRLGEVLGEPDLESRLAEEVGSGVSGVEGCGHSLHLVAGDVDLPCGRQVVEDDGEICTDVSADGGAPSIAGRGCEADAAGEPRPLRVDPDPQGGAGAFVGAGANPVKPMASARGGVRRRYGSSRRGPAAEEGDELVER